MRRERFVDYPIKLELVGPPVVVCHKCGSTFDFVSARWKTAWVKNGATVALFPYCPGCV